MELIPIITAFAAFTSFLILILVKLGIPKSISFSDTLFKKPFKMLFEWCMWICGSMLAWFGYLQDSTLTIVGGALIFCIGLFPLGSRPKWVKIPHMIFAISGYAVSALGLFILAYHNLHSTYHFSILLLLTAYALAAVLRNAKKKIIGVEILISYLLFILMLTYLLP